MRKLSAFLVLLLHINLFMCIPQMEETDCYDLKGKPADDINSLAEFIDQIILGSPDNTPEDEDDDADRTYNYVQVHYYSYSQTQTTEIVSASFSLVNTRSYTIYNSAKVKSLTLDIVSPPPKCCRDDASAAS